MRVNALSADGSVAVGVGFRWTRDGGIVPFAGAATDVSADGRVMVGYRANAGQRGVIEAFRWTEATGFTILDHLGGFNQSYAWGVSGDGEFVVGGSGSGIISLAVRWSPDGRVRGLVGSHGRAIAASRDGAMVAGIARHTHDERDEAFLWNAADDRLVLLGSLPRDDRSFVDDMTPDRRVIVGTSRIGPTLGPTERIYLWTAETGMAEISLRLSGSTQFGIYPLGISDNGLLVIGDLGLNQPAIWTKATGPIDLQPFLQGLGLDLTGWRLTRVEAISGDGMTLAGQGIPPSPSMSGAWIATIPEPSTWALGGTALAVAMLGMLLRRRRALAHRQCSR